MFFCWRSERYIIIVWGACECLRACELGVCSYTASIAIHTCFTVFKFSNCTRAAFLKQWLALRCVCVCNACRPKIFVELNFSSILPLYIYVAANTPVIYKRLMIKKPLKQTLYYRANWYWMGYYNPNFIVFLIYSTRRKIRVRVCVCK